MARTDGRVKLSQALDPLVLAVDVGSTASRGDVFDAAGRPVHGGRRKIPHQFTSRQDGTSEIDPDQIVREVQQIITSLATPGLAGRIGGVAIGPWMSLGEYVYARDAAGDRSDRTRIPGARRRSSAVGDRRRPRAHRRPGCYYSARIREYQALYDAAIAPSGTGAKR
jgi:hypothetical protein